MADAIFNYLCLNTIHMSINFSKMRWGKKYSSLLQFQQF